MIGTELVIQFNEFKLVPLCAFDIDYTLTTTNLKELPYFISLNKADKEIIIYSNNASDADIAEIDLQLKGVSN